MPANGPSDTLQFDSDWRPLRVLTSYRLILAGLLTVLYLTLDDSNPFNVQTPQLFRATLLAYLGFSLAAGFAARLRWPQFGLQAVLQIFADILALSLLMHATGGVTSALGILLVIAVAAGALILPGRLAYLFAAVATLALLYESGLTSLALQSAGADDVTQAGLLGVALFAASGLAHALAGRIRASEALAQQRGIDLANLQELNQHIIRQLQSGIVVVDADGRVRVANNMARSFLGLTDESRERLASVAPELAQQLRRWKDNRSRTPDAISSRDGRSLLPRFRILPTSQGEGALILLDDSTHLAHQAQQAKLASLGRLTASIAHEIRNPLGAISHAAQLLAESAELAQGDRRLSEIINTHTRRVNTIIENVLQLSRCRASDPKLVPLDDWLREFHDEIVQAERIAPEQLRLEPTTDPVTVCFDPDHLHQVMSNLCHNAFSHAGAGAKVKLSCRRGESGAAQLDVLDNGPGIRSEAAEQIFEPFFTTSASGTGLGLYMARELCEVNQAHLSYHPTAEGGSCFRIQFAADQAS
ncbi:MAG: ATP-binding protein [Gammaproteobacteria bacterium]|jgi:two-component system sensor histidine kinase PilS (NtrC family)